MFCKGPYLIVLRGHANLVDRRCSHGVYFHVKHLYEVSEPNR